MILFACPVCGKMLKAPSSGAGRKVPCPGCGQRLQVPVPAPDRNKTVLGQEVPPPQMEAGGAADLDDLALLGLQKDEDIFGREEPLPEAEPAPPDILAPQRFKTTLAGGPRRAEEPKEVRDCPFCGKEIPAAAKRCWYCGETVDVVQRAAEEARARYIEGPEGHLASRRENPAGLVCSILSVVFGGVGFLLCPVLFCLAGLTLGIIGLCLSRKKALGIVGVSVSAVGFLVGLVLLAVLMRH